MEAKTKHIINTALFFVLLVSITSVIYAIVSSIIETGAGTLTAKSSYLLILIPIIFLITFVYYIKAFSQCNLKDKSFNTLLILNLVIVIISGISFVQGRFGGGDGFGRLAQFFLIMFPLIIILSIISLVVFWKAYFKNKK